MPYGEDIDPSPQTAARVLKDNPSDNAEPATFIPRDAATGAAVVKIVNGGATVIGSIIATTDPFPVRAARGERMKERIEILTDVVYHGYANIGTSEASALWTIKKITLDTQGNPTLVQWSGEATAIWNNRAVTSYT